jgi:cytochrome c551/c552
MQKIHILLLILSLSFTTFIQAQDDPNAPAVDKESLRVKGENDYYPIVTIPVPEDVLLEVGGVCTLPDGRVAVVTRRGDVWMIENASSYNNGNTTFKLFASGLHEPLGCLYKDNALYVAQRGELTKLVDESGDGIADLYETVYAWPLSGHYHEYSFGPAQAPDGDFFVTGNVAFGDEEWWRGESRVPMRGWTMKISPDGKMQPWATGMRSPCGYGMIDGELFYDDNQGDWMGSGGLWHVKKGAFTGHPAGLKWTGLDNAPLKLTTEQLYANVNPQQIKNKYNQYIKPENNETTPSQTLYEVKAKIPELTLPSVWLPHGILGISNSEIKVNNTNGKFGPFDGQIFVGDQGQSKVMRVFMEKVKGEYQGAAFDFRNNFQSGVLRMDWARDGSLYIGETNRGWGSAGEKNEGFQRVIWTGKTPFEMKEVKSMPDGFEITFTKPADIKTLNLLDNYSGNSFIYKYFPVYGSPPIRKEELKIDGIKASPDGMSVRVVISNLKQYHIHELKLDVKDADGNALLHPTAFYTLNNIADGAKVNPTELVKTRSVKKTTKTTSKSTSKKSSTQKSATKASAANTSIDYASVKPLLTKYTCTACHNAEKKQIGPAYKEIAKRGYSNDKIVQLIWKPNPRNWPTYATEMAAMPQVKKEDGLKIAAWINSLK